MAHHYPEITKLAVHLPETHNSFAPILAEETLTCNSCRLAQGSNKLLQIHLKLISLFKKATNFNSCYLHISN